MDEPTSSTTTKASQDPAPTAAHREVLRPRGAARYVGVSRPTIDRWRKAGKFPKALQLGVQSIGWRRSDLDEWLNDRPAV